MEKNKLYPDEYLKSTYDIDFARLYQEGYRGVIFDIDNTLVPHGAPADDRAVALFKELHDIGFQSKLLSNNKEPRVKNFCEQVIYATYIFRANKPSKEGYLRACEDMGTTVDNTLFVGDQILTDIWGANNAGIRSIMVEPVLKWKEEPQIILKRFLEAIILLFYKRHKRRAK
ncbi:MAG: HAD-IIIA family hydrolase [Pseudobutyrivibrio sp.]|nr:HAD-IIIA family hydrolase [Pseudobutyrivibrio sp.]